MERINEIIRSVFGVFALAGFIGWLIFMGAGSSNASLLCIDVSLVSMAITLLVPLFFVRVENPDKHNKILIICLVTAWTFTLIIPFALIAMKQGRLVMIGIFIGLVILLLSTNRNVEEKLPSSKFKRWFSYSIFLFPSVYALLLWFDLQLVGLFLILIALDLSLYLEILQREAVQFYESKEHWKSLTIQFPNEEPIVLSEKIISVQHINHLELGFLKTQSYQLQFPISYEINGLHYNNETFKYNWFAPFDDRMKSFDWETDFRGQPLYLIYDTEEPTNISIPIGRKEDVEQMILIQRKQKRKHQIYFVGIAVLGFFLFFFKIAVT